MTVLSSDFCLMGNSFNLKFKPANNRKNRPALILDRNILMLTCIGTQATTRYKIAVMYWHENKSAPEIATELGLSVEAVKKIVQRVAKKLKAAELLRPTADVER